MKSNAHWCCCFHSAEERVKVYIGTSQINNNRFQKLLRVKIDFKLTFDDHIGNRCNKANTKLNTLNWVAQNITASDMNAFLFGPVSPSVPNVPFLYPLKTSACFRGVERGCIGNKWLNYCPLARIIYKKILNQNNSPLELWLRAVHCDGHSSHMTYY